MKKVMMTSPVHQKTIRELVLYGIIGSCTSFLDTAFYIIFTRVFEFNKFLSNLYSVNIGIICSFILNTYFNFKKTDNLGKRAVSFFIVGYCGMGLSMLLLYAGVNIAGCSDAAVKAASIFIVALFQFVLNKLITFSKI